MAFAVDVPDLIAFLRELSRPNDGGGIPLAEHHLECGRSVGAILDRSMRERREFFVIQRIQYQDRPHETSEAPLRHGVMADGIVSRASAARTIAKLLQRRPLLD
jgi:hypothetical protein